jgi:glycosyltransferase involved in cell wall biosynthesis
VTHSTPVRALFVNSGILGLKTFGRFVERAFEGTIDGLHVTQTVLSEGLTLDERVIRRLLCLQLWPDGLAGLRNLDLHRYRAEWHSGFCASRRIRRLESAGGVRFDVLHFHRQAAAYTSVDRMRRTPSIVSIDCTLRCVLGTAGTAIEQRSYRPNIRRDGEIFRAARLIVSTSQWTADCLRREYPDCATDIVVLPNPVLFESFDSSWVEVRHAAALDASAHRPRVLFVGGDFPRKGGHDLLRVWREGGFADRARLDLVTSWPLEPGTLPPGVTVHPHVAAYSESWRTLWRDAEVFVLPTKDEAFGLVFQEAGAAGLPSIGTSINAVPEIVLDGMSGMLVAPGDHAALDRALNRLLASPELRRDMGRAAREHIERTADPNRYRDRLADAIRRLASQAAPVS